MRKSEVSFKKRVKSGNLEGHLRVLRSDITKAETQLNKLEEKRATLLDDIKLRESVVSQVEKDIKKRERDLTHAEARLNQKEEKQAEKDAASKEATKELLALKKELDARERKHKNIIEKSKLEIQNIEKERISELELTALERKKGEEVIDGLIEKISELRSNELKQEEVVRLRNEEITLLNKQICALEDDERRQIESNRKEAEKNAKAIEAIEQREGILAKRERSFLTLKGRLNKQFKKVFPDQNIDNLI